MLLPRVRNKVRRLLVARYGRRPFTLKSGVPCISFTFDDFPESAVSVGGRILAKHGARGTFFVSMGLLGATTGVGRIASPVDIRDLLGDGHEVGCHTFDHLNGWKVSRETFERSIVRNGVAFRELVPDGGLKVFSYPLNGPNLSIKRAVGSRFICCRGGGQTFNAGTIDLNLLKAYFLDWRNRDGLGVVTDTIERNNEAKGWLIFATHDIGEDASRYGCTPAFFEEVVRRAVRSGARVVPMTRACDDLGIPGV